MNARTRFRNLCPLFTLLLLTPCLSLPCADARTTRLRPPAPPSTLEETKAKAVESYGRIRMRFEPNVGQTDPRVRFLSRGSGYALFLTADRAVLSLSGDTPAALSMSCVGA